MILEQDRAELLALLRGNFNAWLGRLYRHEVLVARVVRGMQLQSLADFEREVTRPLVRLIGGRLAEVSLRSGNLEQDMLPELVTLRRAVETVVNRGVDDVRRTAENRIEALASHEANWVEQTVQRLAGKSFKVEPLPAVDANDVVRKRVWLGDTTEKWFDSLLKEPTANKARALVTSAVKNGLSSEETARILSGTRSQKGVMDAPRTAVKALVRTASTHATSSTRHDSFKALGVTHYRFVATLDQRTTLVCASEDGNVYPLGEGPVPPLHVNCRSVTSPVFGQDAKATGVRASIGGPVPASTTFEEWLEQQPRKDQDLVLGKTRAAAWRAGKLTIKQMVGDDLQPLTIGELRELDRL